MHKEISDMQEAIISPEILNNILISVVVPVYNVEKFLPQCIDSLLAQTHPNMEIILVDDGSTDESGAICDGYAARCKNVRVIHKKNGGLSSARNAGIAAASGKYIGFVDSDDFVDNTMYDTMLKAAISHNAQVIACGRYITDEDGNITDEQFSLAAENFYCTKNALKEMLTSGDLDVSVCDKLFLLDIFADIQFPVGEINEDAAIIFQLIARSAQVVHIGKPMYYYRGRTGSITKSGYKPNKIQALNHAEAICSFVCDLYPDLTPFCKQYTVFLCCQLLSLMLKFSDAPNQYPEHYRRYISIIRKDIRYLFNNKHVDRMWKLRGVMIYLNLYGPLYRILKN